MKIRFICCSPPCSYSHSFSLPFPNCNWIKQEREKFHRDLLSILHHSRFGGGFFCVCVCFNFLKRWKLCMQVVRCRLNAFIECWTAECLSLDSHWRRRRCHRWAGGRERERENGICMQMAKNVKIVIQRSKRLRGKETHNSSSEISEWRHPAEWQKKIQSQQQRARGYFVRGSSIHKNKRSLFSGSAIFVNKEREREGKYKLNVIYIRRTSLLLEGGVEGRLGFSSF